LLRNIKIETDKRSKPKPAKVKFTPNLDLTEEDELPILELTVES